VQENGKGISKEVTSFWNRVVSQCRD
jgi:hypothetical protein